MANTWFSDNFARETLIDTNHPWAVTGEDEHCTATIVSPGGLRLGGGIAGGRRVTTSIRCIVGAILGAGDSWYARCLLSGMFPNNNALEYEHTFSFAAQSVREEYGEQLCSGYMIRVQQRYGSDLGQWVTFIRIADNGEVEFGATSKFSAGIALTLDIGQTHNGQYPQVFGKCNNTLLGVVGGSLHVPEYVSFEYRGVGGAPGGSANVAWVNHAYNEYVISGGGVGPDIPPVGGDDGGAGLWGHTNWSDVTPKPMARPYSLGGGYGSDVNDPDRLPATKGVLLSGVRELRGLLGSAHHGLAGNKQPIHSYRVYLVEDVDHDGSIIQVPGGTMAHLVANVMALNGDPFGWSVATQGLDNDQTTEGNLLPADVRIPVLPGHSYFVIAHVMAKPPSYNWWAYHYPEHATVTARMQNWSACTFGYQASIEPGLWDRIVTPLQEFDCTGMSHGYGLQGAIQIPASAITWFRVNQIEWAL